MHKWHQARRFAHHWLFEINEHSLHEPFAYALYTNVIVPLRRHKQESDIENIRNSYINRKEPLDLSSPGASSTFRKRSLYQTAFRGSTSPGHARLLASLAAYCGSKNMLELGTSLGITSLYLSSVPDTTLFTLEGDPVLCDEAEKNLANTANVTLVPGNIDDTLEGVLSEMSTVDFVYFDANHRYTPTLNYFEATLPYSHEGTVLIFDDIHWSAEMSSAWKEICAHPRVTVSMDLFHMGWVFFQPMERKYHYILGIN